jgi:hypothetical protein
MSRDIGMTLNLCLGSGSFALRAGWAAGGLVVAAGIDGQFSEEFAGGGVDDADVEVVDEYEHVGSGVGSADAEVVEAAGHAERDHAGGVDAVVADAGVRVVVAAGGGEGFGEGVVGGCGGGAVGQGPVWPLVVVDRGELVEQGLQVGDGGGLVGLRAQPVLHRLLEPLHLAAGRGVVGGGVLLGHVQAA